MTFTAGCWKDLVPKGTPTQRSRPSGAITSELCHPNASPLGQEQLNPTKPLPHPRASHRHTILLQDQVRLHTRGCRSTGAHSSGCCATTHPTHRHHRLHRASKHAELGANVFHSPKGNHSPELQTAAPAVPTPLPISGETHRANAARELTATHRCVTHCTNSAAVPPCSAAPAAAPLGGGEGSKVH